MDIYIEARKLEQEIRSIDINKADSFIEPALTHFDDIDDYVLYLKSVKKNLTKA